MLQTLSAATRRMLAWVAGGVIIILLCGWWLFYGRKPSRRPAPDQNLAKQIIRQKIPQNKLSERVVAGKKVITGKIPDRPAAEGRSRQAPEVETPIETPAASKIDQAEKKKAAIASLQIVPQAPVKTDPAEIKKVEEKKAAAAEAPATQSPAIPQTSGNNDQAEFMETEKVMPEQDKSASLQRDSQPETILQQEAAAAGVKPASQEIRRENWLLAQDSTAYTVQIIGVSTEQSMLEFVDRNPILKQNKLAYYESTFRGKPWFQLLYGIYPNKEAARLAANHLPDNIRRAGPWIRRVATVQKTIGKR